MAGGAVRPRFVTEPGPDDEVVDADGVRVFVARNIVDMHESIEIAVTPEHENLIVRPLGSKE
jgi:Fe-S cluster assembly iron-binding protein IscA